VNFFAFLIQTIGFTFFDLWGFPIHNEGRWQWYRYAQTAVQWVSYGLVWWLFNWSDALACLVFWWLGGCDVLYYFIGRSILKRNHQSFWDESGWYWLAWTPLGIVQYVPGFFIELSNSGDVDEAPVFERLRAAAHNARVFYVRLTSRQVWNQATIGFMIAIALLLL